jgi:hypothetical protein
VLKHIVEGWSKESCEKAIEDGVEKAALITAEMHNPHIILKDLQHNDDRGYLAELEISTEGVGLHEDYDLKDAFELTGPGIDEKFRASEEAEREAFKQILANYFASIGQTGVTFYIPDFILVPLGRVDIRNKLNNGYSPFEGLTGKSRRSQKNLGVITDTDPE